MRLCKRKKTPSSRFDKPRKTVFTKAHRRHVFRLRCAIFLAPLCRSIPLRICSDSLLRCDEEGCFILRETRKRRPQQLGSHERKRQYARPWLVFRWKTQPTISTVIPHGSRSIDVCSRKPG